MDRHLDTLLAAQEKLHRYRQEAEKSRVINELRASQPGKSMKQHLGEFLIELGYKFAPAPKKAL